MSGHIDPKVRAMVDALTKKLVDDGCLIEAGWIAYRHLVLPKGASAVQIEECRIAFFAGAQHLFGSVLTMLDPEAEPTARDLSRMHQINAELRSFITIFSAKHGI